MRHLISIFLDLLQVRYNWNKFHHCRICLTDLRKEKPFYPPPPPGPWAAPKMYSKGLTATPSFTSLALSEKCANTEIFLVCIFLYSNWILENADQEKLRISALFTQCSLGQLQFHKPRPAVANAHSTMSEKCICNFVEDISLYICENIIRKLQYNSDLAITFTTWNTNILPNFMV